MFLLHERSHTVKPLLNRQNHCFSREINPVRPLRRCKYGSHTVKPLQTRGNHCFSTKINPSPALQITGVFTAQRVPTQSGHSKTSRIPSPAEILVPIPAIDDRASFQQWLATPTGGTNCNPTAGAILLQQALPHSTKPTGAKHA